MLEHIEVEHYALIDHLSLDLKTGFTAITGETGAGKSILLGAISLLLGAKADASIIANGASQCIVEAQANIEGYNLEWWFNENELEYDTTVTLRRQVSDKGRARAFVNDTPVQQSQLKELTSFLLDIHSQHQNLLLRKASFAEEVLDAYARHLPLQESYAKAYGEWKEAGEALARHLADLEKAKGERERLFADHAELATANLSNGEEEELKERESLLSRAQELGDALTLAIQAIRSEEQRNAVQELREAWQALARLRGIATQLDALLERLDQSIGDLQDIGGDLEAMADGVSSDPAELERVQQRQALLYQLRMKYRVASISDLIAHRDDLEAQLQALDGDNSHEAELREKLQKAEQTLQKAAAALSASRASKAKELEALISASLVELGIAYATFHISLLPLEAYGPTGAERIELLYSGNRSVPPVPIERVASGGEMSRVMLSLKRILAHTRAIPSIIFDEIDAGISGEIASRVGAILREMGGEMQVLAITHLPQVAARANNHLLVHKEQDSGRAVTEITPLSQEERLREIAKLLSADRITEVSLANARELLEG